MRFICDAVIRPMLVSEKVFGLYEFRIAVTILAELNIFLILRPVAQEICEHLHIEIGRKERMQFFNYVFICLRLDCCRIIKAVHIS